MHGIINLDKPKGMTSQEAVTFVKRTLRVKKAGHAGTLDPLATGVLLILLGEATKVARFLSDLDKEYISKIKLGERTDTLDSEGNIIEKRDVPDIPKGQIEAVLSRFLGEIRQVPPMYSALKHSGRPLYELARKGIEVERKERPVNIYNIRLLSLNLPYLEIAISCSKGTYIRTLADDIGMALGTGAHITELRRTSIGDFKIEDSLKIKDITPDKIIPIDKALSHLREFKVSQREFELLTKGARIPHTDRTLLDGEYLRLKDPDGRLFAIGLSSVSPKIIRIERLFVGINK